MKRILGHKIGDTLIEVTLAIGIFSLVAITVVSVISGSTSDAQANLETTVTREAIDTQSEALRFIQSSAIANGGSGTLAEVWNTIRDLAQDPESNKVTKYEVKSCSEIYNNNHKYLNDARAFIIDTNSLYSTQENQIIRKASNDKDNKIFKIANAYPRLYYSSKDIVGDALLDDNTNTFESAEGIFVIPVKGANTTIFNGEDFISETSYYDFYIRTCWYEPGNDNPSTISTVARLYDPEAMGANSSFKPDDNGVVESTEAKSYVKVTFKNKDNKILGYKTCTKNTECMIGRSYFDDNNTFDGWWSTNPKSCDKYVQNGGTKTLSTDITLYPCITPIYYTITYHTNEEGKIDELVTKQYPAGETIELKDAEKTFTKYKPIPGYGFKEWNTERDKTGKSFLQSTKVVVNRNMSFYATWVIEKDIQDIKESFCKKVAKNNDYWVKDRRDGKSYTIRWIEIKTNGKTEGNCWMTSDLKVKGTKDNPLSAKDSNFTTINKYLKSDSINSGSGDDHFYPGGKRVGDIPISGNSGSYNFCAAVAGTGNGCTNDTKYKPGGDICPANWKIPDDTSKFIAAAKTDKLNLGEKRYWTTSNSGAFSSGGGYPSYAGVPMKGFNMNIVTNNDNDADFSTPPTSIRLPRVYFMYIRCVLYK